MVLCHSHPHVTSETDQAKYEQRLLGPFQKKTKRIEVVEGRSPSGHRSNDGVRTALVGWAAERDLKIHDTAGMRREIRAEIEADMRSLKRDTEGRLTEILMDAATGAIAEDHSLSTADKKRAGQIVQGVLKEFGVYTTAAQNAETGDITFSFSEASVLPFAPRSAGTTAQTIAETPAYSKAAARIAEEISLEHLVAYLVNPTNSDLGSLKEAIQHNPQAIKGILDQNPGNRYFQEGVLDDFVRSIFAEEHRPLVEITTNAIDALSNGQARHEVRIVTNPDGFQVTDPGIGMSLDGILTQLLIPMISGEEGVLMAHGRFGVGFFSSLSYLKSDSDELTVETFQNSQEGWRIVFRRKKGKIRLSIAPRKNILQGTRVELKTKNFDSKGAQDVLKDTFQAKEGISLYLNNQIINHPENYETILTSPSQSGASVRVSKETITGKGKIVAAVQGAKFFELEAEGIGIPKEMVVDFPVTTPYPVARNTFDVNQATRDTVRQIIEALSKDRITSSA